VSVRRHKKGDIGQIKKEVFLEFIKREIAEKWINADDHAETLRSLLHVNATTAPLHA
jgi:hypothetical protein